MAFSPRRPRPSRPDLVTRIHAASFETPTIRLGAIDISNSAAQEDSSSSESDFQRSKSRTFPSRHARSLSNPFPSFLSTPKNRPGSTSRPRAGTDRGDGDSAMAGPSVTHRHKRGGPSSSKDFATGNCMTCASLMRWPRDLKVFKCTICTTINDLTVPGSEAQKHGILGRRRDGSAHAVDDDLTCQPISLQHCQRLSRQCIHSYISRKLIPRPSPDPTNGDFHTTSRNHILAPDAHGNRHGHFRGPSMHAPHEDEDYSPRFVFEEQPTLRQSPQRLNVAPKPYSSPHSDRPPLPGQLLHPNQTERQRPPSTSGPCEPKRIFKPLEEYIAKIFDSFDSVNSSFSTENKGRGRQQTEQIRRKPPPSRGRSPSQTTGHFHREDSQPGIIIKEIDAKMLLLGDVAENGLWWTGSQPISTKQTSSRRPESPSRKHVTMKSPNMNWDELNSWYSLMINAAQDWFSVYEEVCRESTVRPQTQRELETLEQELLKGQEHTQRMLLKATELLLKRPGRPMTKIGDLRFLLIIMENPLLHNSLKEFRGILQPETAASSLTKTILPGRNVLPSSGLLSGQHSGLIKRIIGLISNTPPECHNQLITWFSKFEYERFVRTKNLVSGFLSYRLLRQIDKKQTIEKQPTDVDITAGLIPEMRAGHSGAGFYLHDEIRTGGAAKKKEPEQKFVYSEDWQIRAASRVLALLFAANNLPGTRHGHLSTTSAGANIATGSTREYGHSDGQLVPTTDFYNSMIDYADLVSDFDSWESKRSKFSFCQYPFLMSIWAKTHILEHDAKRQMQMKARDAFLDSIMTNRNVKQYLCLDVRRECLVEDSLAAVSEVIGSGSEDVKKGLRITFRGEEGIDAGGLRKEWFLLLVREVFNPDHGMFLYDEDSQYCYFNPATFETSDQFFLVGVVMGLAIYNSTILDVALPPFAFRKLLAAAPAHGLGISSRPRPSMQYTLEDLAEYRPRVARGLRQLLDFEGDVENTFVLDFVIDTDKYGTTVQVPLCPGGAGKVVTNSNRREYVDLYIRYVLDTAVTRQFEPFKRGFYTVCGGNAFSLFRPEEIELLIRGSDEALDIATLRAVAEYDNWKSPRPDGSCPVVGWFWDTFQEATPANQRKLLLFITGSDRIPATGAAMLPIKISCLGEDIGRYPIARTCFNMISLWQYGSKQKLESMVWRAVFESEGFGLK
ncbi:putative E3 ubiquitin-protein ligase [Metarhizium rileyi]|uniref:HECT-type E3 ubiquitin transferase n=1 Tax=Metarhizium rileyi (strain RCEF 4871) TaxID=1649241 RepID=A0A5C6GNX0_METRR|nr:putative E3 ubiquitin-protein ligase [Metarhizium rileyi]